jgi:hypothetical protein
MPLSQAHPRAAEERARADAGGDLEHTHVVEVDELRFHVAIVRSTATANEEDEMARSYASTVIDK